MVCWVLTLLALVHIHFCGALEEATFDRASIDLEDDEFEGFETETGAQQHLGRPVEWEQRVVKEKEEKPTIWIPQGWQIYALAMAAVYGVHFLYGRDNNERRAHKWADMLRPALPQSESKQASRVYKDSMNLYKMYVPAGEGDTTYTGILLKLNCYPRWDLMLGFLNLVGLAASAASDDMMTIELPLVDNVMEPFVMAVCRSRDRSAVRARYKAVAALTNRVAFKHLPKGLELHTDCPEAIPKLFDAKVIAFLMKCGHSIRLIQVTDSNKHEKDNTLRLNDNIIRIQVQVKTLFQMQCAADVVAIALHLSEVATSLGFNQKMRSRAWAARGKVKW